MGNGGKHFWLNALGRSSLPDQIQVGDRTYSIVREFKHDFFAATGLYEMTAPPTPAGPVDSSRRKVVLKVGRTHHLLGLPLRPLGRWLARRESRCYQALRDVEGVPAFLGHWADTGLVHEYIDGHPLIRGERVNDEFFPRLRELLRNMHARGIAYVDLEKRANILVGDDGKPYLFDFQISFGPLTPFWRRMPVTGFLLRRLQRSDEYHLLKHHRRHRPDQLDAEQVAASYRRPFYIQLHRVLFRPWTYLRRAVLRLLLGDKWKPRHDEWPPEPNPPEAPTQRRH